MMTSIATAAVTTLPRAADIPRVTHAEANRLAQTEYERVLDLLESLAGDDWQQTTYCTAWNVRDMVAHLAGAVAGYASLAEFLHQTVRNPYLRQAAVPVDGINTLQVEDRSDNSVAELVAEFRDKGQRAVDVRYKLPWLLRKLRLPMGGDLGVRPVEYLLDVIYPRDQWMHRYDICAATGQKMIVTAEHDKRLVALVLRDIAVKLERELASGNIVLRLTGDLSGAYRFGQKEQVDGDVTIDGYDFNLLASGRITAEEAEGRATIGGDRTKVRWFLTNLEVTY